MSDEDPAVTQDRLNRVITALFIERSGEENSLRWGGPAIADLVADNERWMMDLLRDTVNAGADFQDQMLRFGEVFVDTEPPTAPDPGPCPQCGGTEYRINWVDTGDGHYVSYVPGSVTCLNPGCPPQGQLCSRWD